MDTEKKQSRWTDEELAASVDTYLKILALEEDGQTVDKPLEQRILQEGALINRTTKAVDFRLQNLSFLFVELGLKPNSYPLMANIGSGVAARVEIILASKGVIDLDDYLPTADEETLNRRTEKLRGKKLLGVPEGIEKPKKVTVTTTSYARSPRIKAWILDNAKGICEGCDQPGPFEQADGTRFLEVHHVKHLANRGSDRRSNAVALCPNCHKRCHHANDKDEFTATLYQKVERLKREQLD
ncbi:HNH endonuclease [Pseudomonas svalbardensis]|uniref:HNH endonuclease n=1 Tax=Pseudomonas svalbardensis TaxID=3042029 RepID=UPI0024B35201|nr:HNH endonuclease [Pseudomonas sp. PMCC200367]